MGVYFYHRVLMQTQGIFHRYHYALQRNPFWLGVLLVGSGAFLISFSSVFVKISHTGPTADAFYRMWFGGIALMVVAVMRRERLFGSMKLWWLMLIAAICISLDLLCWHRSINIVGPGLATILGNFQVFFLFLLSVFLYGERFNVQFILATVLALVGLFMLVGLQPMDISGNFFWGVFFGLCTAVFYSIFTLVLRQTRMVPKPLPVFANLGWISLLAAAMLFVTAQIEGASLQLPTFYDWGCLIAYGLVSQLIGWVLISKGLPKIPLSLGGLLILLQPTFSFLWDILFFQRPTTGLDILGTILTLSALYLGFLSKRDA